MSPAVKPLCNQGKSGTIACPQSEAVLLVGVVVLNGVVNSNPLVILYVCMGAVTADH